MAFLACSYSSVSLESLTPVLVLTLQLSGRCFGEQVSTLSTCCGLACGKGESGLSIPSSHLFHSQSTPAAPPPPGKGKAQGACICYTYTYLGKHLSLCTGKPYQCNRVRLGRPLPTQLSAKGRNPSQVLLTKQVGESGATSAQRRGC